MKKVYIAMAVVFVTAFAVTAYLLNKPHRDIAGEAPAHSLTAEMLFAEFESDESAANAKYLDQVVQVTGGLSDISGNSESGYVLVLDGVACSMLPDQSAGVSGLSLGDALTVKGHCTGYDGLLEVKMSKCTLIPE